MFYSKSTGGFYTPEIHGEDMPPDVVEITDEDHAALLDGQNKGQVIAADKKGFPVLVAAPAPTAQQAIQAQIAALEASVTPRRIREAVLGTDGGWIAGVDSQIKSLRAKL